jgi:hypothetical protein
MKTAHSVPQRAGRAKLRRRTAFFLFRLKTGQVLLFLIAVFCGALITFIVTFYLNSDYLSELIEYIHLARTKFANAQQSPNEIIQNYQPRQFEGKHQSINYDQYIEYHDFDFMKNETLTYQRSIYSNDSQLLFRLPFKTSISAVLLVFHSCQRTAADWFHTSERQRILGAALDLGLGCLVFQALNTVDRCWSHAADIYENEDVQNVFRELDQFYAEHPRLGRNECFASEDNDRVLS